MRHPLMGIPFYKQADWKNGHPSTGAQNIQSDTATDSRCT